MLDTGGAAGDSDHGGSPVQDTSLETPTRRRRDRSGYGAGARAVAPLAVAVAGFGLTFGSLARSAGLDVIAATVMSGTTFAGSAQFAAVSILTEGGTVAAAVIAAVLLNARYGPMGIAIAPVITGPWWRRLLLGQLVVDETWAIAHRGDGRFDRRRLIGAAFVLYPAWVLSSIVGAAAATALDDPEVLGFDAAFPALFLALLWPQLRQGRSALAAGMGGLIALATLPFAPPGIPIILAAAACLLGLRR